MNLFDILKARAGIPVHDKLALMIAERTEKTEPVTVYRTADHLVYRCSDGSVYALKED